jgi:hypothetical protein
LAHPDQRARGRIRRPGGGRQRVEKKCPRILVALAALLRDAVAGDSLSGRRWTHKSIRKLWGALRKRGLPIGHGTLARLRKRSRAEGDKSRATPKPGLRCVAMRVLADTSVDVSDALKTVTRTQRGVSDRSAQVTDSGCGRASSLSESVRAGVPIRLQAE